MTNESVSGAADVTAALMRQTFGTFGTARLCTRFSALPQHSGVLVVINCQLRADAHL